MKLVAKYEVRVKKEYVPYHELNIVFYPASFPLIKRRKNLIKVVTGSQTFIRELDNLVKREGDMKEYLERMVSQILYATPQESSKRLDLMFQSHFSDRAEVETNLKTFFSIGKENK